MTFHFWSFNNISNNIYSSRVEVGIYAKPTSTATTTASWLSLIGTWYPTPKFSLKHWASCVPGCRSISLCWIKTAHLFARFFILVAEPLIVEHSFAQVSVSLFYQTFRMSPGCILLTILLISQTKGMSFSFYQGFLIRLEHNVIRNKVQIVYDKTLIIHWWFCWEHSVGLGLGYN